MRRLTLTFDNGPDRRVTRHVLRELLARDLRATFFPVGERLVAAAHLELMRRAHSVGHRIGNHTFSHPRPFGALGGEATIAEIERTDELLGELREPDRLFRPSAGGGVIAPGVLNRSAIDHLLATRHTLVMWNVVCEDWKRPDGSWIDLVFDRMRRLDWTLLVLHDIDAGAMDHLGSFLDRALSEGVEIVPELPPDGTPIVRGDVRAPIEHLLPG